MSNFWRKKEAFSSTPKTDCSWSTIPTLGSGFHWGNSSIIFNQHKWILTVTKYFKKWIEEIPTRQETYSVIIQFLEGNIFSRFGCPYTIIIDNVVAFKSLEGLWMVGFSSIILLKISWFWSLHCIWPSKFPMLQVWAIITRIWIPRRRP